jgi:REP element-mobilizing transposase RayT
MTDMARRVFVKPEAVSRQLELPTNRLARAHNRQNAEIAAGKRPRGKPGRPKKATPSAHAVSHRHRPRLHKKEVLHLTLKLRRGLQSLRRGKTYRAIERSFFKYSLRDGFRLVHFSIQHDHLHFIAEADSKSALTQAMQRLNVSLARQLNFVWKKLSGKWTGRVFKERYHQHVLRNPNEVRAALLYVLRNALKHRQVRQGEQDYYSSARYFDGFSKQRHETPPENLIAKATAWLLTTGWRDLGLIKSFEVPRS